MSAILDNSSAYGRMSAAPNAQFKPIVKGFACRTEFQKASTVCPDKIRPDASVTVPDNIIGKRNLFSSKYVSIAKRAALQFKVSKIVSTNRMSTPPSTKAFT